MLHIIGRGDKLLFIAVILMLLALGIWLFTGTIRETVSAKGVINSADSAVKVSAPTSGTISEMNYSMSDYVNKGDLIARVVADKSVAGQSGDKEMIDVISDASGFVTEVSGYEGDRVSEAAPMMTMIKGDPQDLDVVIALVDYEALNLIDTGAKAQVRVEGFSEEKFGYLTGEVIDIDLRLINQRRLSHMIGNEMVADTLLESNGSFVVVIKIDKDADGNFVFSRGKIDSSSLKINSSCDVTFIVGEISPYKAFLGEE